MARFVPAYVRLLFAALYCLAAAMTGFAHAAPVTPDRDPANFVLPGSSLSDFCVPGHGSEGWAEHCAACQIAKAGGVPAPLRYEALLFGLSIVQWPFAPSGRVQVAVTLGFATRAPPSIT